MEWEVGSLISITVASSSSSQAGRRCCLPPRPSLPAPPPPPPPLRYVFRENRTEKERGRRARARRRRCLLHSMLLSRRHRLSVSLSTAVGIQGGPMIWKCRRDMTLQLASHFYPRRIMHI